MQEFQRIIECELPAVDIRLTAVWAGAPFQAYGWIGNERFYFRYRYGYALLEVGTVDIHQENENRRVYLERAEANFKKFEEGLLEGEEDARDIFAYQIILENAKDDYPYDINKDDVIPMLLSKSSHVEHGEEYDMLLSEVEGAQLFVTAFYALSDPDPARRNKYALYQSI